MSVTIFVIGREKTTKTKAAGAANALPVGTAKSRAHITKGGESSAHVPTLQRANLVFLNSLSESRNARISLPGVCPLYVKLKI